MNRTLFLKILGAAAGTVGALISAGVLPASYAVIVTVVGIVAGALHPQIMPAVTK